MKNLLRPTLVLPLVLSIGTVLAQNEKPAAPATPGAPASVPAPGAAQDPAKSPRLRKA